eukprot:5434551-Amphidinium_carterae.1
MSEATTDGCSTVPLSDDVAHGATVKLMIPSCFPYRYCGGFVRLDQNLVVVVVGGGMAPTLQQREQ